MNCTNPRFLVPYIHGVKVICNIHVVNKMNSLLACPVMDGGEGGSQMFKYVNHRQKRKYFARPCTPQMIYGIESMSVMPTLVRKRSSACRYI